MKKSSLTTSVKLAIAWAIMLPACLGGQGRDGRPLGDVRTDVGRVLSRAHLSGSIEYRGACNYEVTYPDFPKILASPDHDGPAVDLLREMFSVDPEMTVSQDDYGRIRMIEKYVPTDLLDVRIQYLRFSTEYHGPNAAAITILRTPEVIAFQREHSIGPEAARGPGASFSHDAFDVHTPSVRGEFYDVTVRQALDYVLRTFPGFWFYENCQNPGGGRIVNIGFFENLPDAMLVSPRK